MIFHSTARCLPNCSGRLFLSQFFARCRFSFFSTFRFSPSGGAVKGGGPTTTTTASSSVGGMKRRLLLLLRILPLPFSSCFFLLPPYPSPPFAPPPTYRKRKEGKGFAVENKRAKYAALYYSVCWKMLLCNTYMFFCLLYS